MRKFFKALKIAVMSLIAVTVVSCGNTSSSSSSSSSSSTSSSSVSSSSTTNTDDKVYGSVPAGMEVLTVEQAVALMNSSDWQENDELCVKGVVTKVTFNSSFSSYTIDLEGGFQVYSGKLAEGLPEPEVGDTIVASGKSKIYTYSSGDKVYEIAYASSHKESPVVHQIITKDGQGNTNVGGGETTGTVPAGMEVLTTSQAVALMNSSEWQENDELCVKGVVTKVTFNSSFGSYTVDLEGGFQVYSGQLADGVSAPEVGDTIVASGKSKIYTYSSGDKVYEIAYSSSHKESPIIHQVTKGGSGSSGNETTGTFGTVPSGMEVLTTSQAVALMDSSEWQENDELCVKGVVTKVTFNSSFGSYTVDLEGGFQVYSGQLAEGVPAPEVGDTIVASGKSKIYTYSSGDKVYEIAYSSSHKESPVIHQVIKG